VQNTLDLETNKLKKGQTVKGKIEEHLAKGFGMCMGSAIVVSGWHQGAGRTMLQLMADNPTKYHFFEAQPSRGGSKFRIFFQPATEYAPITSGIGIVKSFCGGWVIKAVLGTAEDLGRHTVVRSPVYSTMSEARAAIKECTKR